MMANGRNAYISKRMGVLLLDITLVLLILRRMHTKKKQQMLEAQRKDNIEFSHNIKLCYSGTDIKCHIDQIKYLSIVY